MLAVIGKILDSLSFWIAWIIIPLIWEVIPALGAVFVAFKRRIHRHVVPPVDYLPYITILVPVYNSQKTLPKCLDSIFLSSYPADKIEVMLVDNGSTDKSHDIFIYYQQKYFDSRIWWLSAEQGKSKALNMGIYNSSGKYVFNIDSDGFLEENALLNMVARFEGDDSISCMTGTILIDPDQLISRKHPWTRLVQKCELFEYVERFLVGRSYQCETNTLYTISGAFSAFRKDVLIKTQLYNSVTVGEDTHLTFQIRYINKLRIYFCDSAVLYVDPIESSDKLYTQRKRWQRGEIEVSALFLKKDLHPITGFFKNFMVRVLMYDHTFAFPRAIWYFALFFLLFIGYPLRLIVGINVIVYLLFCCVALLNFFTAGLILHSHPDYRKYYRKQWPLILLAPLYNMLVYFIRFAGIIDSISEESAWRSKTFSAEKQTVKDGLKRIFRRPIKWYHAIRDHITN